MFRTQGTPDRPLPKGISTETAHLVEQALRDSEGDMSASECAAALGLSRVSARRYLEHLATLGKADVRPRYGGPAAPSAATPGVSVGRPRSSLGAAGLDGEQDAAGQQHRRRASPVNTLETPRVVPTGRSSSTSGYSRPSVRTP